MISSVADSRLKRHNTDPDDGSGKSHQSEPRRHSELLGDDLRQYREHASLTSEAAAEYLSWSRAKLVDVESGVRCINPAELDALTELYEISRREVKRLRSLRARASKEGPAVAVPTHLHQFHHLQASATIQRTYAPSLLPPICQIEDYATALLQARCVSAPASDPVNYQLQHSRWLLHRERPLQLHLVLGEAALYNLAGTRRTMIKQLDHLAKLTRLPHVNLQILPFDETGHATANIGYTLLACPQTSTWLRTDSLTTVTCTDDLTATAAHQDAFDKVAAEALGRQDSIDRVLGVQRAHATFTQRRTGIDTEVCRRLRDKFNLTYSELGTVFDCSIELISKHLRQYSPDDALPEPIPGKPAAPWRPPTASSMIPAEKRR